MDTERRYLTDEETERLVQRTLVGARPAMAKAIGDRTPAQYDRADRVAEGIAYGLREALADVGLRPRT